MQIKNNVNHHFCNEIPKGCSIFHVAGDEKYEFKILEMVGIDVNYCPYCGGILEVKEGKPCKLDCKK